MSDNPSDRPLANAPVPKVGAHTPALDAESHDGLAEDPACEDAQVDIGVDESFPASDPVSAVQPRKSDEPPPSSGYRE